MQLKHSSYPLDLVYTSYLVWQLGKTTTKNMNDGSHFLIKLNELSNHVTLTLISESSTCFGNANRNSLLYVNIPYNPKDCYY